ncbi:MAG: hypothetical protein AAGD25_32585 [Cyanobacteria bacterium P01_F01_bin.150]
MLMTVLLSFASLQEPQMIPGQLVSHYSVTESVIETVDEKGQEALPVSFPRETASASFSLASKACSKASYSRRSCGGTGRRQVLS